MGRINVVRSSMPPIEEFYEEIKDIWDSRWLTHTGPKHQELAEKLAERFGVKEVSLFANGHLALKAALSTFPAGSEVITTPYTFASTTLAIVRCGLIPVFCDIESVYYTMDPEKIEPLITEKTVAIVPVHVYGHLCDWRRIREIAQKHDLKVIYDAAHAFGVLDDGRSSSSLGDISMLSFHATKVFHTIEGGALVHNDSELSRAFASWRQFGMRVEAGGAGEQSEVVGTNAKLTEFAAAMGLCNLRHIDGEISLRRKAGRRYYERLSDKPGIILCPAQPGVTWNYAYMPVLFQPETLGCSRDDVLERLKENDIYARKYFYPICSQFPICANFENQETPIAKRVSEQILCLPLYAGLTVEEVDRICEIILAQC